MHASDKEWFEDDAFWARTFGYMFSEAQFTSAAQNAPSIVALTGVSAGKLLDLACGPGRYAIPFAQAGFEVTGVDRSSFLLGHARERAAREGAPVEWIEQDMRAFVRPGAFDLAINVYTSLGYFDDAADNVRVLDNVYASLKPGGTFLFDHIGKELLAARFQPTISEELPAGAILVQRTKIIDGWSRIAGEWTVLHDGRTTTFRNCHWLYSGQEIRGLLEGAGFVDIALYGSFAGAPYAPGAQRLIAVARKPAE